MSDVQKFWRPIINDFNPVGQALPEDIKRFFVDRNEADPTRSLLKQLKLNFQNSIDQPKLYKSLLTGHIGSGKSSELMKLGEELAEDFFVVWFDAELSLTAEKANHFDVILGMGLSIYLASAIAELNVHQKLIDDLVKSMAKFIRKYEDRKGFSLNVASLLKQITAFGIGSFFGGPAAGGVAALAVGAFEATKLELNVSDDLVKTLELPANRQEVIGALNKLIESVQLECKRPLLVIIDGLDKVRVERAQMLFADSSLLREPGCALIYAAPIEFYYRFNQANQIFNDYPMLPNVSVQKKPETGDLWKLDRKHEDGDLEVMRKVVARRLEFHKLKTEEIIEPAALNMLARMSGGVMRELIRAFRDAATFASLLDKKKIDEEVAKKVINQQQQEISLRLTVAHREALQKVLQAGKLLGGQAASVEDELVRNLLLLSYQDESESWFDAHPNAFPLL